MRGCRILSPVRYGLRVQNTVNPDAGDWSISDSMFWSAVYDSAAAIRVDSSGGGKITNCKINANQSTHLAQHGIDINFASGVLTGDFAISNCSIENVSGNGINLYAATGSDMSKVHITGVQVSLLGTNTTGYGIAANSVATNLIHGIIIAGCLLDGPGAHAAISLTNVWNVRIGTTLNGGSFSTLFAVTTCNGVRTDLDRLLGEWSWTSGTDVATGSASTATPVQAASGVTFTAPGSGSVLVRVVAGYVFGAGGAMSWSPDGERCQYCGHHSAHDQQRRRVTGAGGLRGMGGRADSGLPTYLRAGDCPDHRYVNVEHLRRPEFRADPDGRHGSLTPPIGPVH